MARMLEALAKRADGDSGGASVRASEASAGANGGEGSAGAWDHGDAGDAGAWTSLAFLTEASDHAASTITADAFGRRDGMRVCETTHWVSRVTSNSIWVMWRNMRWEGRK